MSDVRTIIAGHRDKLEAVGSKEQLALHLQTQGIRAERKSSTECAIAVSMRRALQGEFPDEPIHVWVCTRSIKAMVGDRYAVVGTDFVQFIQAFDAGVYPELVAA